MLGLELYIGNMGFTKFLYIKVNVGPDISTIDEFQYFVVWNYLQEYNYSDTGVFVCEDYQQIVYRFCC